MLVATIKIKHGAIQRVFENKTALLEYIAELTMSGIEDITYTYTFRR